MLAAAGWAVRTALLVGWCCLLGPLSAWSAAPHSSVGPARHKTGPVTIRGTVRHPSTSGFTLHTTKHGDYAVTVTPDTSVTWKGRRATLYEGDHVGVHALPQGRSLRAIWVHVYSVVSAPYSVKGAVTRTSGGSLVVSASGRQITIAVTGSTVIQLTDRNGTLRDIHVGDRVSARVRTERGVVTALHIHVYARKTSTQSVEVTGTITAVTPGQIVVRSGSTTYRIGIGSETVIYFGADRVSASSLRVSQSVRVYACCAGQPLVARSVHVTKTAPHAAQVTLRGRVVSMSKDRLLLSTSTGTIAVRLSSSTTFGVGADRVGWAAVHVGDDVLVRAYRSAAEFVATRVHVSLAGRRPRTIRGVVVATAPQSITVRAGGKDYRVVSDSHATIVLGGSGVSLSAIKPGDRVRATGRLTGTTLTASVIAARRPAPKTGHVTGTVTSVAGSRLVITDSNGLLHAVRLAAGAAITLHGRRAPADALFPGVHATAWGTMAGNEIMASRLTLTVTTRTLHGRLRRVLGHALVIGRASTTTTVDLPSGAVALDGSRRLRPNSLPVGVYLQIRGYVEATRALRATVIRLLHPALDITGTLVRGANGMTVRTAEGEDYRLVFGSGVQIIADAGQVDLRVGDLGVGMRVHVEGTMRSDGSLATTSVTVRLAHVTLRTRVAVVGMGKIGVGAGADAQEVRITGATTIVQGSQPLLLSDVVVGDDVTVYGYRVGSASLIARKMLVHRRRIGIDGVISSVSGDGLSLTTGSGTVQVLTSPATTMTGSPPTVGLPVHVSGYLRGDGAVLATSVRVGKKRQ